MIILGVWFIKIYLNFDKSLIRVMPDNVILIIRIMLDIITARIRISLRFDKNRSDPDMSVFIHVCKLIYEIGQTWTPASNPMFYITYI